MTDEIIAFAFRSNEPPIAVKIPNSIDAMMEFVDGRIEVVSFADGLVIVCNEEGKMRDLPAHWVAILGVRNDPIAGNFLVCRREKGVFVSINPDDGEIAAPYIIPAAAFR